MKTKQLLKIIGKEVETKIVAGKYGDATLHENGFVTADPCYLFDDNRLSSACYEKFPWKTRDYVKSHAEWQDFDFEGKTVYWRDTDGDGIGFFGHYVDSGWIVAIPISVCPERIRKIFNHET